MCLLISVIYSSTSPNHRSCYTKHEIYTSTDYRSNARQLLLTPTTTTILLHVLLLVFSAVCAGFAMSTDVGFIGLFIAAPDLRAGRGYGKITFMAILERLGRRNVLLDSVAHEVGRYIHFGLTSGEATVYKMKGKLTPSQTPVSGDSISVFPVSIYDQNNYEMLLSYDRSLSRLDRRCLLDQFIQSGENLTVCALEQKEAGNVVCRGYVLARKSESVPGIGFRKLYMFYADSLTVARQLLGYVVRESPADVTFGFMYPSMNKDPVSQLFQEFGLTIDGSGSYFQRMYTQADISFPWERVFCSNYTDCGLV